MKKAMFAHRLEWTLPFSGGSAMEA